MLPRQADAVEATLAEIFFNFDRGRLADFRRTSMATCTGAGLCLAASPTAAAGLNPSMPNTVPNPPPVPVPPVRAAPGGVSSGRVSPGRLAPGRAGALPDAEPCSVFDEEPCFPPKPIGQDLRLTIVSTDDESPAKPPDADSTKHGNDADSTGDKQHDAKSLDSIAEM